MKYKCPNPLVPLIFCGITLFAQESDSWGQNPDIAVSGFADIYYVYDFNRPQGSSRQPFLYNHNRHNEFNLNLGFLKLGVEHQKYRANVVLQAGTYANDNYAAEPGLLKSIFEANIGLSLNKQNNLWIDAGVLPSHLGFESAISMQNLTLTRSLSAENSPYFLAGAKLTFTPNDQWEIAALMVNGWQRIQRLQGSSLPSFGTQVSFSHTERMSFNWSTFVGTDDPDATRRMRYFNNFYGRFQLNEQVEVIAGVDIGTQQRSGNSSVYDVWFSPVIIAQLGISENWKTAFRAEYYQDRTNIIVQANPGDGFETTGLSLNLDYVPSVNLMCRLEGRWLNGNDGLFERQRRAVRDNLFVAASIAIQFSERIGD